MTRREGITDASTMQLLNDTAKALRTTSMASLSIAVIGPMLATVDGREVRLRSRKCRAVLAYLALSETRQETRERLVGLLWSESEEGKARASLRQILHELGEALAAAGYQGLARERLHVALAANGCDVDGHDPGNDRRGAGASSPARYAHAYGKTVAGS